MAFIEKGDLITEMNRRDFIKTSLLLCGCSYLAMNGMKLHDFTHEENTIDGIKLEKKYLVEAYKDKSELPRHIRLEACSLCQLNCVCCPMRMWPDRVKNGCGSGYLTFKNFKKLVDDNEFEEIELSNSGEIFLNPELLDIIKYSYKKNIKLIDYVGVNLNYLPDKMAEALVKYKMRTLTVSLDSASPETYVIYRRGGDFNTVINNIKKINYYKEKYNSKYPLLVYKFILFGHNEHEIDKAKELAEKLNMSIRFITNSATKYSPVKNVELVKKKTGLDPTKSYDNILFDLYQKDHHKWFFCKLLWEAPQINWDGKVLGCCYNYYGHFGGNAFDDGLLKALNHPKMIYAKNMLIDKIKPLPGIPCTGCNIYQQIKDVNLAIIPKRKNAFLT